MHCVYTLSGSQASLVYSIALSHLSCMHYQKWLWHVPVNLPITSCLHLGTLYTLTTAVKGTFKFFSPQFQHRPRVWINDTAETICCCQESAVMPPPCPPNSPLPDQSFIHSFLHIKSRVELIQPVKTNRKVTWQEEVNSFQQIICKTKLKLAQ